MRENPYELLILAIERDLPVLKVGLPLIRCFLRPSRIRFIASRDCIEKAMEMGFLGEGVEALDEDMVVEGITLSKVRDEIVRRNIVSQKAGWYFKQILLLAYASRDDADRYYLVWDADTIPVRRIEFFDEENHIVVARKTEYHQPYFDTMKRLLGIERIVDYSFISEHMLFDRNIVLELLRAILGTRHISGLAFLEAVIAAVDDKNLAGMGFSEYETYGNFAVKTHPGLLVPDAQASIRQGTEYFGRTPSNTELFALGTRYYWASFEAWGRAVTIPIWKRALKRALGTMWARAVALMHPRRYFKFKQEIDEAGKKSHP